MAGTPTFAVDTVGRMSDARKSPPFSLPIRSARKKVSLAKSPTFFELSAVQESDDDSPRISSSSSPSSSSPLWFPSPLFSLTTHRPFLALGHSRGWRRRRRTFYYSFSGDIFIRRRGGRTFPPASSCAAPFGPCPCRSLSSTCPVRARREPPRRPKCRRLGLLPSYLPSH